MTTSFNDRDLEIELIRDEGIRSRPYKDTTGHTTIGIGHNLDARGLCAEAIMVQLRFDVREKLAEMDRKMGWFRSHPDAIQRALINLAFNLGVDGLLKFTYTLDAIKDRDYPLAAQRVRKNEKYFSQVKGRAERIAQLIESA